MLVNGKDLAKHLKIISMGGRVKGAVLGPNFEATVADDADQVLMHGESDIEFKTKFGVSDIVHLAKVIESFGPEVDLDFEEESGKLKMTGGGVTVQYQTAAIDVAQRKHIKWKAAVDNLSDGLFIDAELSEGFLHNLAKYTKLIKPQIVELTYRGKELIANLLSEKSHGAEIVMGPASTTNKKKLPPFRVNSAAFSGVLDCVPEGGWDDVSIGIGKALSVEFGKYRFFVEPIIIPEGVSGKANGKEEGEKSEDDYF